MTTENVDSLYARWQNLTAQAQEMRQNLVDLENAANDAYREYYSADMSRYREQNA